MDRYLFHLWSSSWRGFERHSGMMLVTDVAVSRQEYFGKKKSSS